MFAAFDLYIGTQRPPENLEFRPAEPLTNRRRRADRTVILDQQETALAIGAGFGHIAFLLA